MTFTDSSTLCPQDLQLKGFSQRDSEVLAAPLFHVLRFDRLLKELNESLKMTPSWWAHTRLLVTREVL